MAIIFYDSKRQLRLESRERENKDDLLLLSCIMIIIIIENEFCVHWHMSTSWTRRLMAEITTRPTVHSLHSHPASSSSSSSYSRRRFVLLIIFMHRWRCAMQSTRRGKLRRRKKHTSLICHCRRRAQHSRFDNNLCLIISFELCLIIMVDGCALISVLLLFCLAYTVNVLLILADDELMIRLLSRFRNLMLRYCPFLSQFLCTFKA